MNTRRAFLACLPVPFVAAASPLGLAQEGGDDLHDYMEEIEHGLEEVGEALESEEAMAAALGKVTHLQRVAIDAKDQTPKMVLKMEEGPQRDRAAIGYRLKMQDMVRGLLDLEAGLARKDAKAAKKAMRDLEALEESGHKEFRKRSR